jgi:hypothetical protein
LFKKLAQKFVRSLNRQGRDAGSSESEYESVELKSGKPLDVNERWTDTWMKMPGGKWQRIASHVSSLKT